MKQYRLYADGDIIKEWFKWYFSDEINYQSGRYGPNWNPYGYFLNNKVLYAKFLQKPEPIYPLFFPILCQIDLLTRYGARGKDLNELIEISENMLLTLQNGKNPRSFFIPTNNLYKQIADKVKCNYKTVKAYIYGMRDAGVLWHDDNKHKSILSDG